MLSVFNGFRFPVLATAVQEELETGVKSNGTVDGDAKQVNARLLNGVCWDISIRILTPLL